MTPVSKPILPLAIAALIAGTVDCFAITSEREQNGADVTCTNQVNGASWQIKIDYGNETVDANPARVTKTKVSWHDSKDGRNYTLDRISGKLTIVLASSTGGHFLYGHCAVTD